MGGVPLSRTFSTALVRAHKAGDACVQNDIKGGSAEPKEPPWIRHCRCSCVDCLTFSYDLIDDTERKHSYPSWYFAGTAVGAL